MNPLEDYPEVRQKLYLVQYIVNGILGVAGVMLAILGKSPVWFVLTTAGFNFLWAYTGITAASNVTALEAVPEEPRHRDPGD